MNRNWKMAWMLVVGAVAMLVSGPAWAQYPDPVEGFEQVVSEGAGDVAVIVAIDEYAFLPDVPGAGRNGEDWKR